MGQQLFEMPDIDDVEHLAFFIELDIPPAQHVAEIVSMQNGETQTLYHRFQIEDDFCERFVAFNKVKHDVSITNWGPARMIGEFAISPHQRRQGHDRIRGP